MVRVCLNGMVRRRGLLISETACSPQKGTIII